jgi:hypothetical protein
VKWTTSIHWELRRFNGYQKHPGRKRVYFINLDGNDWAFMQDLTDNPEKRHDYTSLINDCLEDRPMQDWHLHGRTAQSLNRGVNRPANCCHADGKNSREKVSNKFCTALSGILAIGVYLLGETGGVTTRYLPQWMSLCFSTFASPDSKSRGQGIGSVSMARSSRQFRRAF